MVGGSAVGVRASWRVVVVTLAVGSGSFRHGVGGDYEDEGEETKKSIRLEKNESAFTKKDLELDSISTSS